ncbi:BlaI/MecI/CopY family transcriptional regulator [Membranihabitans maritimus]|uniref:BlaI/MecI/CopY family transcriptional regulator n=1 Tax=Membranihabitans maritimus TaxID=2904244 RepID=UPI001F163E85|nr:BlaI/MecI/CopY family transcriptional regulator [Membranihabitans maritimus]
MKNQPTEGELAILQLLWDRGPLTVREVHDIISADKKTTYTTTLKMMQIMNEKKLLGRNSRGRSHVYHANVDQKKTTQGLLNRFMDLTFGGSASKLVMQLLGSSKTDEEELEKIRELLDDYEKNKN